jgi:5-methylcytosine-specific restriction protein A
MSLPGFEVGYKYRRADIHDKFGGQRQGGISTPAQHPFIFVFTGASGRQHGYVDEWTPEGFFRYFGEGQKGDMTLTRGNLAIANQKKSGKEILLFEVAGQRQVEYRGSFDYAGHSFEDAPDSDGISRRAIVFRLVPRERREP